MDFNMIWLVFLSLTQCQAENLTNTSTHLNLYVEARGYKLEDHEVQTEDGYLLTYHRIKSDNPPDPKLSKYPVLLQHSLITSSADFLVPDKDAPAYVLVDGGFDVWLGNSRGNQFSKGHISLDKNNSEFWNFGVDEMAIDIAAGIEYILTKTDHSKVFYVGHSHGAMYPLILADSKPEYIQKVAALVALAPAFSMTLSATDGVRLVLDYIKALINLDDKDSFYTTGSDLEQDFCFMVLEKSKTGSCDEVLEGMHGNISQKAIENAHNFIFGTSKKALKYVRKQTAKGGIAKTYNKADITYPVHVYFSDHDVFVTKQDVDQFINNLTSYTLHQIQEEKFNHLDFVWGTETKRLVYKPMVEILSNILKGDTSRRRRRRSIENSPRTCDCGDGCSCTQISTRSKRQSQLYGDLAGFLKNNHARDSSLSQIGSEKLLLGNNVQSSTRVQNSVTRSENLSKESKRFLNHIKENYLEGSNSGTDAQIKGSYEELLTIIEEYKLYIETEYRITFETIESQEIVFTKVQKLLYMLRGKAGNCEPQCKTLLELLSKNEWLQKRLNSLQSEFSNWQLTKTGNSEMTTLLIELKRYEVFIRSHGIIFEINESEAVVIEKLQRLLSSLKSNCLGECRDVYTIISSNQWFINHVSTEYLFEILKWKLSSTENNLRQTRSSYDSFVHNVLKYKDYFECRYNVVIESHQSENYYVRQALLLLAMMERENKCNGICQDIKEMIRENEWVNKQINIHHRVGNFQEVVSSMSDHNKYIQDHYHINLKESTYSEKHYYEKIEKIMHTIESSQSGCSSECQYIYNTIKKSDWWEAKRREEQHTSFDQHLPREPIIHFPSPSIEPNERPIEEDRVQLPTPTLRPIYIPIPPENPVGLPFEEGSSNYLPTFKPIHIPNQQIGRNELPTNVPSPTFKPITFPNVPDVIDSNTSPLPRKPITVDPEIGRFIEQHRHIIQTQYNITFTVHETVETFVHKVYQLQQKLDSVEHCFGLCREMRNKIKESKWIEEAYRGVLINHESFSQIKLDQAYKEVVNVIKLYRQYFKEEFKITIEQVYDERYIFEKMEEIVRFVKTNKNTCLEQCEKFLQFITNNVWYKHQKLLLMQTKEEFTQFYSRIEKYISFIKTTYNIELSKYEEERIFFEKVNMLENKLRSDPRCFGHCKELLTLITTSEWYTNRARMETNVVNAESSKQFIEVLRFIEKHEYFMEHHYRIRFERSDSETIVFTKLERLFTEIERNMQSCTGECKEIYDFLQINKWFGQRRKPDEGSNFSPTSSLDPSSDYRILLRELQHHVYIIKRKFGIEIISHESESLFLGKLVSLVTKIESLGGSCVDECRTIYEIITNNAWYQKQVGGRTDTQSELRMAYEQLLRYVRSHEYFIESEYTIEFNEREEDLAFFEKLHQIVKMTEQNKRGCEQCNEITVFIKSNKWYQSQYQKTTSSLKIPSLEDKESIKLMKNLRRFRSHLLDFYNSSSSGEQSQSGGF